MAGLFDFINQDAEQGASLSNLLTTPGGVASFYAPQRDRGFRQSVGTLFGVDTRTEADKIREEVKGLNLNTKEGQERLIQLIQQVDPAKAAELQASFQTKAKPNSAIGQLNQDLANGFISQEDYDSALASVKAGQGRTMQGQPKEVPGKGFNFTYDNGTVEFVPYTLEQRTAFLEAREEELEQMGALATTDARARNEETARASLGNEIATSARGARENLNRLERLEQLTEGVSTGSFGAQRVALGRLFGQDVADEEEFMSLSNYEILAAAGALKGAISERENAYIEGIGTGIGKSLEGNKAILRNLKVIAENAIERQKAYSRWGGKASDFFFEGQSLVVSDEETPAQVTVDY